MFTHEAGFWAAAYKFGKQQAVELVGDINEYTRRYRPHEPDGEPVAVPGLLTSRCLLDFNQHFIELSNGEEHLRSLLFATAILMFGVAPCIGIVMVIAGFVQAGFGLLTIFSLFLLVGTLTLCYFLWPFIGAPAFFTSLRARYRFNRTTRKVYVLRPKRHGGNAVLDWDRVQAHVRWRVSDRMTHEQLRDPTARLIRQSNLEHSGLVLYWPPLDATDPERKGEDILWIGPEFVFGEFPWQYIRTFMEEGMDAVPFPGEADWLRKGFSSPGELMRENATDSTLLSVMQLMLWPVRSLAERLCYWPTFPEEWNSDCGQKRRESGIGPEEPLRWNITETQRC